MVKNKNNSREKFYIMLSWILIILWMAVIISFSGDTADVSKAKSNIVIEKIEPIISKISYTFTSKNFTKDQLHFFVRKNAHMFNYCILSILLFNGIRFFVVRNLNKYKFTILGTLIFASIDEFYQTFIPGRSGELRDVLIDNLGSLIGLFLIYFFLKLKNNISHKLKIK